MIGGYAHAFRESEVRLGGSDARAAIFVIDRTRGRTSRTRISYSPRAPLSPFPKFFVQES